jgi:hypothetical protein
MGEMAIRKTNRSIGTFFQYVNAKHHRQRGLSIFAIIGRRCETPSYERLSACPYHSEMFDMRVLVIDGSSSSDERVKAICHMLDDVLTERKVPHENVPLEERKIVPCKRCGNCWVETPGLCVANDDSNALNRSWIYADMVVLLTRMTYGCYSSRIKDLLDKHIGSSVPYMTIGKNSVRHEPRYERTPSILSIVVCDELNHTESETFKMLAKQLGETINSYNSKSMIIWSGQRDDDLRPMIDSAVMAMKVRA